MTNGKGFNKKSILRKVFGFNEWHMIDLVEKPSVMSSIRKINSWIESGAIPANKSIVEIGCGLGDLITSINHPAKYGYDVDGRVIKAAKILHPFGTRFKTGSFDDIKGMDIAVLIAENFLHSIDDITCRRIIGKFVRNNDVEIIVVDDVSAPPYAFHHDWREMLGEFSYELIDESKGYIAYKRSRRKILYFKKREN